MPLPSGFASEYDPWTVVTGASSNIGALSLALHEGLRWKGVEVLLGRVPSAPRRPVTLWSYLTS